MNLALLWHFTRQDLVDRYAGSMLGGLWTFVQPIATMLVFILVFSRIMSARLPEVGGAHSYSIYLISGLLGWIAFSSSLMRTTQVFLDRAHFITRIPVSLPMLPLSIVLGDTIIFALSLAFFGLFLIFVGHRPDPLPLLWIPLVFALQQAFAYTLGLILACFSVFYRDIKEAVGVLLQLWFWLTPIVYVDSILADEIRTWLQFNPIYPVVDAYHAALLGGSIDITGLARLLLLVGILAFVGRWVFRRLESDIRDLL